MSDEKEVKVLSVTTHGLGRKQVHLRAELPYFPDQNQIDSIELAAKHIMSGRQVVLSGENIQMHYSRIPANSHDITAEIELINSIVKLQARLDERDAQYAELKAEKDKLQSILDALDGVFQDVYMSSTRGKERAELRRNLNSRLAR